MLSLLFYLLLSVHILSGMIRYKHQDEFESFLDMVERQMSDEDENEAQDEGFILDKSLYRTDRHGRRFVTCVEHNSTATKRYRNVRCTAIGSTDRPGCFAMYDFVNDEVIQGCYNYQKEIADLCETTKQCLLSSNKRIGFCCCAGERCNSNEEVQYRGKPLLKAIEIYKQEKINKKFKKQLRF